MGKLRDMITHAAGLPADDRELSLRLTRPRRTEAEAQAARAALQELYRKHAPGLLAFLAARLGQADVEDVHQTVWQHVWQHAPAAFDGRHFRGWLYRIARNLVTDHRRRRRPEPLADSNAQADTRQDTALAQLLDEERRAALASCLERLSPSARDLVRGRLGGEGYAELCKRLRLSSQAAYKAFHTAVQQLGRCLEDAGV